MFTRSCFLIIFSLKHLFTCFAFPMSETCIVISLINWEHKYDLLWSDNGSYVGPREGLYCPLIKWLFSLKWRALSGEHAECSEWLFPQGEWWQSQTENLLVDHDGLRGSPNLPEFDNLQTLLMNCILLSETACLGGERRPLSSDQLLLSWSFISNL